MDSVPLNEPSIAKPELKLEFKLGVLNKALPPVPDTPNTLAAVEAAPPFHVNAVEALVVRLTSVKAPAENSPLAPRLTIVDAVLALVDAFARVVAAATFAAEAPPTRATAGFGYVPDKSPPAAPEGLEPPTVAPSCIEPDAILLAFAAYCCG